MSLEANSRHVAGVTIFDLSGRMVAGAETDSLRDRLLHAFERGEHWILLNFEDVTYVDSAGLGEMVSAYAALTRRGGILHLLNVSEHLAHLLALTRLDQLFDVFDDQAAALASFNSAGNTRTQRKLADYLDRGV
ncbi:Anti-sigma factor antagonist [Candidatus Sulfopaludibacter sp. SbA3]|nr:Anti-sigma factor antagonist [Candidatus Sulfopaludibacter sp. SbA3]